MFSLFLSPFLSFFFFFFLSFFLSFPFPRSGSPDVKQRRYGLKFWFVWIGLDCPQPAPGFSVLLPVPPLSPSPPPPVLTPSFLSYPLPLPFLNFIWGVLGWGWGPALVCVLPSPLPTLKHSIHLHLTLVSDIKRCLNSCRCLQSPFFCVFLVVYLAFFLSHGGV